MSEPIKDFERRCDAIRQTTLVVVLGAVALAAASLVVAGTITLLYHLK